MKEERTNAQHMDSSAMDMANQIISKDRRLVGEDRV